MFVAGSYIAEIFKPKISIKGLKYIAILLFFLRFIYLLTTELGSSERSKDYSGLSLHCSDCHWEYMDCTFSSLMLV